MNEQMHPSGEFKPLVVVGIVLLVSLGISQWAGWYGSHVSIPRYCGNHQEVLARLKSILTQGAIESGDERRNQMVAAKLLFLLPRDSNEPLSDYLIRMEHTLQGECR